MNTEKCFENFKQYKTDGSVNTEEFKNVTPQAA